MAKITFKGNTVETCGELPAVGSTAPDFLLTKADLSDLVPKDLAGQNTVINVFPSIDTGVCAQSERQFNKLAAGLGNVRIISVSRDLPFALKRFCAAEGIDKVTATSEMRNCDFGQNYGLHMLTGPLAGLLARCVIVLDGALSVKYVQLVPELTEEPDYDQVMNILKKL